MPDRLLAALTRHGAEGGWRHLEATLVALRASGLADAVAVMTPRMEPPPGSARRLREVLRRAGAAAL